MNINKQLALEAFSGEAFLSVNKTLLKIYDPNTAVFLSNLVDKYRYFEQRDMLVDEEWFFITHKKIQEQVNLSDHQIRSSISQLKKDGIIEIEKKGIPAKNHYKIAWRILSGLVSAYSTRSQKITPQGLKKLKHKVLKNYSTNKDNRKGKQNKETKEKNTKKESSDGKELFEKEETSLPSYSIDDAKDLKKGQPIDYQSFVDFFNEVTGGRCRMTDGKKRDIKKQLKVFTGAEIKQALKNRSKALQDSQYLTSWESIFTRKIERMEKYLTLSAGKSGGGKKPDSGHYEEDYEFGIDGEV